MQPGSGGVPTRQRGFPKCPAVLGWVAAGQNGFLQFAEEPDKLLYRDEVYAIQGALFDVYKTMGNMWGEEVYQQCLEKELSLRNIPFEAKKELPIFYKGEKIEKKYIPDVFCFGKIILELKAVGALADEHRRQILNYLRMTKCKLGLLINFGSYPRVTIERFAL